MVLKVMKSHVKGVNVDTIQRRSIQFGNSTNSSWPQCVRPNYVSTGDQNDI